MQNAKCRIDNPYYGAPQKLAFVGKEEHRSSLEFFGQKNDGSGGWDDAQSAKCKIKGRGRRQAWYVCFAVFMAACIITSFVRAANVEYETREVVVQEGDTLWGIWEEVGYGRFDAWMVETKKLNDKDLTVLQPYDRVTVSVIKD